jgi:hypothetical protein
MQALLCVFALSLLCANVFSQESEAARLLRATRYGYGKLIRNKLLWCLLLAAIVGVAVYGAQYATVAKDYPLGNLDVQVGNLPSMMRGRAELAPMTIGLYLLNLNALRLLGLALSAWILAGISSACRSVTGSVTVSLAVTSLPVMAVMAGLGTVGYASLFPFLSGNMILQGSAAVPFLLTLGYGFAGFYLVYTRVMQ